MLSFVDVSSERCSNCRCVHCPTTKSSRHETILSYPEPFSPPDLRKGTMMQLWSTLGVERMHQFWRGTREVRISPMNFNSVDSLFAVSLDVGTVQVVRARVRVQLVWWGYEWDGMGGCRCNFSGSFPFPNLGLRRTIWCAWFTSFSRFPILSYLRNPKWEP